jgi:hypothetical protein
MIRVQNQDDSVIHAVVNRAVKVLVELDSGATTTVIPASLIANLENLESETVGEGTDAQREEAGWTAADYSPVASTHRADNTRAVMVYLKSGLQNENLWF